MLLVEDAQVRIAAGTIDTFDALCFQLHTIGFRKRMQVECCRQCPQAVVLRAIADDDHFKLAVIEMQQGLGCRHDGIGIVLRCKQHADRWFQLGMQIGQFGQYPALFSIVHAYHRQDMQ
ncbi:hypothetical protein D3C81_1626620 [compost metagenome]